MQSAANCTGLPSSSESRVATGRRLILGLGLPLGRPRCEARIRRAPCSTAYRIVGSVARIDNLFTGLLLHLETESSRQKANNASSLAYRLQLLTSDRSEALGVLHHRSNRCVAVLTGGHSFGRSRAIPESRLLQHLNQQAC